MIRLAGFGRVCLVVWVANVALFAAPTAARCQTEIRYAAMPLISQAPIIIAQRRGFFTAENIKLTVTRVASGPQGLEAMMARSVDAAHISDTPMINALANGIDIVVVADNGRITRQNTQSAILVKADSSIQTLADLKGKKIANLPPGTITDVQLRGMILPKVGLRPGVDVTTISAGFPQMPGMLRSGTVDAILEVEPFVTMLTKSGEFRTISKLDDYIPEAGNYLSMITFRREYVVANRDTIRRFLRAYLKGVAVFQQDTDARVAALNEWAGIPADVGRDVPPITISLDGRINPDALVSVVKTLMDLNIIKKSVDVLPHIDNSLLP